MEASQSSRVALARVGLALALFVAAIIVADVVVAAAAQMRDRRSTQDHPVQVRPWVRVLIGLGMLLTAVGWLTSPQ